MENKIRPVGQRVIVYGDIHLPVLFYEDNNELVDFDNTDIWIDIKEMY